MKRRLNFVLDPGNGLTLQAQLRTRLAGAIADGTLPHGARLPASRDLAAQLGISRNTVVLAYQQLVAEGLLTSRERSGIFVDSAIRRDAVGITVAAQTQPSVQSPWLARLGDGMAETAEPQVPPHWPHYPFPFLDGRLDPALFPVEEWREANRLALARGAIHYWSTDGGDADDPMLIDEIRCKLLPRRGIFVQSNEILITSGAQQALALLVSLLITRSSVALVEEPGNPDLREMLLRRGAALRAQTVDGHGLMVDDRLAGATHLFVTPGNQVPTGAVMSVERRRRVLEAAMAHDLVIVEDDSAAEASLLDLPPALYALDQQRQRVLHVGGLGQVLAPGLQLGFIVAPAEIIGRLRRLRRLAVGPMPLLSQRSMAYFLSLGHYDAFLARLGRVLQRRRMILRDAINHYMRISIDIQPIAAGPTFWVTGGAEFDAATIVHDALQRGILIEATDRYFIDPPGLNTAFRMGVSAIPEGKIRPGVAALAQLIRERQSPVLPVRHTVLEGEKVVAGLSGRRLLYRTVYGDPCSIDLLEDGTMVGSAGYAHEDRDRGRWWIEGDFWCRQWQNWAFGEPARYRIAIDGNQISWLRDDGSFADSALIAEALPDLAP